MKQKLIIISIFGLVFLILFFIIHILNQRELSPEFKKRFTPVKHKKVYIEKKKDIVMIDGIPYERFKGYLMPPEPDEEENNKTLLGIDVNKNFVRDDLERRYVKSATSKVELGDWMQHARIYQMQLSNEKTLPMSDLLIKMRLQTGALGSGIRKQVGNTPERERRVGGGIGAGVYEIPSPNSFTMYVYGDYKFPKDTKDNDFSGYEWSMEFYEDKPFPLYSETGNIDDFYYKGKTVKDLNINEFCYLNTGLKDINECKKVGKARINKYKEKGFYNLLKDGTVDKQIEEQNKRLAERNWYE